MYRGSLLTESLKHFDSVLISASPPSDVPRHLHVSKFSAGLSDIGIIAYRNLSRGMGELYVLVITIYAKPFILS